MTEPPFDFYLAESQFWQPIGQFVISFGYLEISVNHAIAALLQVRSRQGAAVTSQILNLRARIQLIERLCTLITSDANHRREARKIVKEINDLNSYRNNLLHGPWGAYFMPTDEENYWSKSSVNPQNYRQREFRVKLSELTANITRVVHARSRLDHFVQRVVKHQPNTDKVPPSPDIP